MALSEPSELEGTTGRGVGGDAREAVGRAVLGPHAVLGHLADAAVEAHPPDAGLVRMRQLADGFMAGACSHLVAVEETILPVVRRRLPHGRAMVAEYVAHVRALERALHHLQARLYGEAHASRRRQSSPWPRLHTWLAEHAEREAMLLDSTLRALDPQEAHVLARRVALLTERAPTRPHPYAPHIGVAGRVSHRILGVADAFWDSAQGRSVSHSARPRTTSRDSLLRAYVLGVPTFDDTPSAGRAPARTGSRSADPVEPAGVTDVSR